MILVRWRGGHDEDLMNQILTEVIGPVGYKLSVTQKDNIQLLKKKVYTDYTFVEAVAQNWLLKNDSAEVRRLLLEDHFTFYDLTMILSRIFDNYRYTLECTDRDYRCHWYENNEEFYPNGTYNKRT